MSTLELTVLRVLVMCWEL